MLFTAEFQGPLQDTSFHHKSTKPYSGGSLDGRSHKVRSLKKLALAWCLPEDWPCSETRSCTTHKSVLFWVLKIHTLEFGKDCQDVCMSGHRRAHIRLCGVGSGRLRLTWIRWILCVESIHGRSIKLENQVESIQREWIDSTAGL